MSSKTFLLSGWEELHAALRQGQLSDDACFCKLNPTIALKCESKQQQRIIRVWNTNSWFGFWHDELSVSNFIGAMDYTIHDDHIVIDYLCANDEINVKLFENSQPREPLSNLEATQLMKSFICFVKNITEEENISVIRKDVHQNMFFYEKYLMDNGFITTGTRCEYNPQWLETEVRLSAQKH
jgi:hypothetical protein